MWSTTVRLPFFVVYITRMKVLTPYLIPTGGSSPVGAVGFVNAGFELKGAIDAGHLGEPKTVFVPLGTMGTAAGLLLGLRAAGLSTRLVGVRVTPSTLADPEKFQALYCKTNELLRMLDPSSRTCAIMQETFPSAMNTLNRATALPPRR